MIVAIARMVERPPRFIVAINLVNIPLQPHLQYLLVYHHSSFVSMDIRIFFYIFLCHTFIACSLKYFMAFWEVAILNLQCNVSQKMVYLYDQSIFVNSGLGFKKRKQVMVNNFRKRNADDGSRARCGPNNLLCSKLLCGYCGPGLRLVALIWRIRQRRPIAKLQEDLNRSRHHSWLHQNQIITMVTHRPARIAELPRSKFDPELFPHSAYVEIFVTFVTKVPYLTFCNKM